MEQLVTSLQNLRLNVPETKQPIIDEIIVLMSSLSIGNTYSKTVCESLENRFSELEVDESNDDYSEETRLALLELRQKIIFVIVVMIKKPPCKPIQKFPSMFSTIGCH